MLRKSIDYTGKDFSSIRSTLLNARSSLTTAWTDNSSSDIGITLLELFAYVGDMTNYYIDRAVNECFTGTALHRQSLYNLASWLGYTPKQASTSLVTLQFSASNTSGATIPEGTKVSVADNSNSPFIFETTAQLVIGSGSSSGTVTAVAATLESNEIAGESTGIANQKFRITKSPLAYYNNSFDIDVEVNEGTWATWSLQEDFSDSSSSSTHYKIECTENDVYYVVFGDGTYGKIPTSGSSIRITYRVGAGVSGNSIGVGKLTKILSTVPANITGVTNTITSYGGSEKESVEQIRSRMSFALKSRNRAVTVSDYKYFAENYTGIALAKAYSDGNVVNIIIVPETGGMPSSYLKDSFSSYMNAYKMIGTRISLVDPTYKRVSVRVQISVEDGYSANAVAILIAKAIESYLAPIKKDKDGNYLSTFGKDVHVSKLYAVIEEVSGVESAKIMKLADEEYISDPTLPVNLAVTGNYNENINVKDIIVGENEIAIAGNIRIDTFYGTIYSNFYNPDDSRAIQNTVQNVES